VLRRAVRSALAQTHRDIELIVVDDASTDDTEQVAKGFRDPRVQYVRHPERRGGSAARNTGIEHSRGGLIAFLDSDDEWLPDKLRHQLDVCSRADTDVGLIYSDFLRVNADGSEVRHRPVAKGISVGYPSRWIVKRDVLAEVGGFDEGMPALQDTEVSIRMHNVCATLHDPVVVMKYYVTGNSVSRSAANIQAAASILIERYGAVVPKDELSYWYVLLGKAHMALNQTRRARRCLARAVWLRPLASRHYAAVLASFLGRRAYLWLWGLRHAAELEYRT
jgi:glycosyltransferase involved in cell wall biosynthesis